MPTDTPLYDAFRAGLDEISFLKVSRASLDDMTARYGAVHSQLAEDVLRLAHAMGWDPVEVFTAFIIDYLKQQRLFERKGHYGHDDFEKIRAEILENRELMTGTYLPGVILAYPMTAIAFSKYVFFVRSFLPRLTGSTVGTEIGYGGGFFLWLLLREHPELRVIGFDISPSSQEFAQRFLAAAGLPADRYDLQIGNVFAGLPVEPGSLDWAILAEVIEHIPNPVDAIREAGRTLKPGGLLYVATMIDCNHMDHISNFESPAVVEALMTDNGFTLEDDLLYRVTDDLPDSRDRAVGLAYVARKVS